MANGIEPTVKLYDPQSCRGINPAHFLQLDGLRGLAASYVLLHHVHNQVWNLGTRAEPSGGLRHLLSCLRFGHYAVDLFIVMSGFCLAMPVLKAGELKGGVARFAWNRFWRIVPPYWAAVALSLLLVSSMMSPAGSTAEVGAAWKPGTLLACFALFGDYFSVAAINEVFWSVAVEAKIYLIFPLIVTAWRAVGFLKMGLVVGLGAIGLAFVLRQTSFFNLYLWYTVLFLMGMGAARVVLLPEGRGQWLRSLPWGGVCGLGAAAVLAMGYHSGYQVMYRRMIPMDLLVGLTSASGLVALTVRPNLAGRWLAARPLVMLGAFSYSLYLIHMPIVLWLDRTLIGPVGLTSAWHFVVLATVALAVTLPVSYGFYLLVERRCHQVARSGRSLIAAGAVSDRSISVRRAGPTLA